MLKDERTASQAKRGGILWGVLAAITCPCHLLILAAALSGTALGALLQQHFTLMLVLFSLLFALSLWALTRTRPVTCPSDARSGSRENRSDLIA